jgi:iron(III) transport system substrate-binding protein
MSTPFPRNPLCTLLTLALLLPLVLPVAVTSAEQPTLTVVATYENKGEIFTEFHKKTGILIHFLDMAPGEILARTEAEGGRPLADLWFGAGIDSFVKARDLGLLEVYRSPEAEAVPDGYKDPEGYWTGVSLQLSGLLVNTDLLAERNLPRPKLWADLVSPEYREQLLIADPAISSATFTAVAGLLHKMGEEEGWRYFEALAGNVAYFTKSSSDPQKKVASGQVPLAVVSLTRENFSRQGKSPVQAVFPKDGIPWMALGVAIFKNARNPEGAKAFIDWALSLEGQKIIQAKDPRIMVRPNIPLPKEMDEVSPSDLIDYDIVKVSRERRRILEQWSQRVVKKL